MTSATATESVAERDPIFETDFIKEMLRQMRALDSYGQYDGKPPETILDPFVLTKERKKEIPLIGDPDEITMARVKAFYNGIAVLIEKECGLMAVPMIHLTHEGFGRTLITVGKLVVLDRTLRDVHRFGFESLSRMKTEADKYLSVAIEIVGKYPEVAGL
jgi:probable nitrogen fixation protein